LQYVRGTQSRSLPQLVGQELPPRQRYGLHVGPSFPAASDAHVPCVVQLWHPPVHVLSQHAPFEQNALPHAELEVHGLPLTGP
jgi:hypothetical protein